MKRVWFTCKRVWFTCNEFKWNEFDLLATALPVFHYAYRQSTMGPKQTSNDLDLLLVIFWHTPKGKANYKHSSQINKQKKLQSIYSTTSSITSHHITSHRNLSLKQNSIDEKERKKRYTHQLHKSKKPHTCLDF